MHHPNVDWYHKIPLIPCRRLSYLTSGHYPSLCSRLPAAMQDIAILRTGGGHQNFPGKDIWEGALAQFQATLTDQQRQSIGAVTSLEGLIGRVEKLQKYYADRYTARWFGRLAPVLTWLTGFNYCVHSFLQASPPEFVVLWGSLSFVLEVGHQSIFTLYEIGGWPTPPRRWAGK